MPKGIYTRTEQHRKINSETMKNTWKNNRKKMLENCYKSSVVGGRNVWKYNYEKMRDNSSRIMKNNWENKREEMLGYMSKGGKTAWKNNRERMLEIVSEAGKIGGKIGGGLKSAWKNDRNKMLELASKAGKLGGKTGGKNNWKNNRKEMLGVVSKAGKIGGKVAWKTNREKMIEISRKGGKAAIQKQQKLNPSPIELIVRSFLDDIKIKHRDNIWFRNKEADIVIDKYKLIVECDGFMHSFSKIKQNDEYKTKLFNKLGFKVLRLTGIEIRNGSYIGKFLKRIGRINVKETK